VTLNMNHIVGRCDLLLVTLDTLRFDVATRLWREGRTPELARRLPPGGWEELHTPGSFTYAAHAAFFAGFDVPEHHPHTRNSAYIPAGLDAAVSWPSKDLRVSNPYPFHVRVRATAYRGILRIELMGARRAPRVEGNIRVVQRIRRSTEREVDTNMVLGTEEIVDEGEDGSVMERTRTVDWPDGAVTETVRLRYPVVTRLVRAGPQTIGGAE